MENKIILWDNDGTITGSLNPNDRTEKAKMILPGVKNLMKQAKLNFIISGYKSPESESQNFDPEQVITKFIKLMSDLPVSAATFSPYIGGIACYVVIKKLCGDIEIRKAHEDQRYKQYIGQFKKPDIGMFIVIKDVVLEEFGEVINATNTVMIGDTWHDETASLAFGIPFTHASIIHQEN